MNTREKAIVDSRDLPSTTTETNKKFVKKTLTPHQLEQILKTQHSSPSLKTPLTVNDSSVFCEWKTRFEKIRTNNCFRLQWVTE